MKNFIAITLSLTAIFILSKCMTPNVVVKPARVKPAISNGVEFWLTKMDQSVKLQKQTPVLAFGNDDNQYPTIEVDELQTFQQVDGFGFSLMGGSAQVINHLNDQLKQKLLQELFGKNENAISISYLRLSIGASDLNEAPFTYDDMPNGQTDHALSNFNLVWDQANLVPLLKDILLINPNIKIIATPWSAPLWMKDNNSFIGGSLQTIYYAVYAQYFVKYIQRMKKEGIVIDAIAPQNEPLNPKNNPSMLMTAAQQSDFIKNHLGPAFQSANISTKIIIYDHNCDKPEYPIAILNDPEAKLFIAGSAFHLYDGEIGALSLVHNAHPDKNIYFTEQYTADQSAFADEMKWHLRNVIIGSMRNWSKIALEWNLANDPAFEPHTQGGCTTCKGALTIDKQGQITRNAAYYIIAHASKFVPSGSVRIASNLIGNLYNVAFITVSGKKVLIVENDGGTSELFNIKYNGKWITTSLESGSAGTYIW